MKVILLQDIKGVGKKGDVINASDGHAKNYLLPKKMAVEATSGNINQLENKKKNDLQKLQEELEEAQELGKNLESLEIVLKVKTGENGKLFGTVTNKEIAKEIKDTYGYDIDKKKITLKAPIKMTGTTECEIKLHPKVTAKVDINIISE